jgi:hypothetical protein
MDCNVSHRPEAPADKIGSVPQGRKATEAVPNGIDEIHISQQHLRTFPVGT